MLGRSAVSDSLDLLDCSPPGSSVHGILRARILEWVAILFSRGSSWPRSQTRVSCIGRQILYPWAIGEAPHRDNYQEIRPILLRHQNSQKIADLQRVTIYSTNIYWVPICAKPCSEHWEYSSQPNLCFYEIYIPTILVTFKDLGSFLLEVDSKFHRNRGSLCSTHIMSF